jgi:hypothetical protein
MQNTVTTNFRNAAILAVFSGASRMQALQNMSLYPAILNNLKPQHFTVAT